MKKKQLSDWLSLGITVLCAVSVPLDEETVMQYMLIFSFVAIAALRYFDKFKRSNRGAENVFQLILIIFVWWQMVTYGYNITTSHITCLLTSSIGTLTVVVYGILKKKEPRPDIPPNEKKRLQHNLAERKKITDELMKKRFRNQDMIFPKTLKEMHEQNVGEHDKQMRKRYSKKTQHKGVR